MRSEKDLIAIYFKKFNFYAILLWHVSRVKVGIYCRLGWPVRSLLQIRKVVLQQSLNTLITMNPLINKQNNSINKPSNTYSPTVSN